MNFAQTNPMKTIGVRTLGFFAAAGVLFLQAQQSNAITITGVNLGTAEPPTTLGGYTMTPFGADARTLGDSENNVPSPLGGSVGFSPSLVHRQIDPPPTDVDTGWSTWSHGYVGDVYDTGAGATTLTLSLPANTGAFYFYAEPATLDLSFDITAVSGTTSVSASVNGTGGANGYGFYSAPGESLTSITITAAAGADGFAVGEFGIAAAQAASVPETGATLVCLAIGLFGLGIFQRRLAAGNRAMAKR